MEKIKEIFALISSYIEMGLNHVLDFLSKDLYILYGAIAVVLRALKRYQNCLL